MLSITKSNVQKIENLFLGIGIADKIDLSREKLSFQFILMCKCG